MSPTESLPHSLTVPRPLNPVLYPVPQVNERLLPLPLYIPEAGLAVHARDSATRLAMDTGLELWIQRGHLEFVEPEAEVTVTKGLCGPKALTPLGTPQLEPGSFQASWQEAGSCSSEWPSCPANLRARYAGPKACGQLSELTGPFAACAWTLPVGPFVDSCVEELRSDNGSLAVFCQALAAVTRACQTIDIPVGTWRGPDFCGELETDGKEKGGSWAQEHCVQLHRL